ncbi:MAG: hypothetical protein ACTHNH_06170 [Mesorhizobium sp.]
MKKVLMAFALTSSLASAAQALEPRYDHNLEKAAAEIVAARMGDIRGGFSFGQKPQFVVVQSVPAMTAADIPPPAAAPDDGLVPAVEGPPGSLLN